MNLCCSGYVKRRGQPESDGAGREPHSQYRHSVSLSTIRGGLSKNRRGNESDKQQLSGFFAQFVWIQVGIWECYCAFL